MRTYHAVWLVICGVLAIVGAGVAFIWTVPAMLILFGCTAAPAGAVTGMLHRGQGHPNARQDMVRLVGTNSMIAGTAAVALVGLVALLGTSVWPLLALLAGGSPYAIRHYRRLLAQQLGSRGSLHPAEEIIREEQPVAETNPAPAASAEPQSLSDPELCRAWRASFTAQQRASSLPQKLLIAEARHDYLDELERRHPDGVRAWLASGAPAAGDPSRFVLGTTGTVHHPIDWDELMNGLDR